MLLRNMRREFLTRDEPHACLRENGVDDLAEVKRDYMEGDGSISVVNRTVTANADPLRQSALAQNRARPARRS